MYRRKLAIGLTLALIIVVIVAMLVMASRPPAPTRETLQQTIDSYMSTLPGLLTAIPK